MDILKYCATLLLAGLLTSCYEEFDPGVTSDPVLCINSLITVGKPVEAEITHTWFYTDASPSPTVDNATLTVTANGTEVASDYTPREGDRIGLRAVSPTYGVAEAEVTVPHAPAIAGVRVRPEVTSVSYDGGLHESDFFRCSVDFNLNIDIEIADNSTDDNFYHYGSESFHSPGGMIDLFNPSGEQIGSAWVRPTFSSGTFQYENEPIFSEHIAISDAIFGADNYGFSFFTDRTFSCSSYTLHLRYTGCYFFLSSPEWLRPLFECGLTVTLDGLSESYYNWVNYLWQRDEGMLFDYIDLGFGDPVWGYSNVSTYAGVVAAHNSTTFTVDLTDFLLTTLAPFRDPASGGN